MESQLSHGSSFSFTLPLFSLAKFLTPVITHRGRLRDCLSLITIEIAPLCIPFIGNWDEIRLHCLQLLEPCILGDKDAILPAMGRTGLGETLVILASTDQQGARVIEKRIREQLERSGRLRAICVFKLSSVALKLPPGDARQPVAKVVQEIADSITELTMATLRRSLPSTN